METKNKIYDIFNESIKTKEHFVSDEENINAVVKAAQMMVDCINGGGKVLVLGNGGSAADSQHMAAELVVRFEKERKAFPCIALSTDTSIISASSNDYTFDEVFKRQVEAFAGPDDIIFAISTSGNSENVIRALREGRNKGAKTISLTGRDGGKMPELSDAMILVKASNTARIQEVHGMVIHAICKIVEEKVNG